MLTLNLDHIPVPEDIPGSFDPSSKALCAIFSVSLINSHLKFYHKEIIEVNSKQDALNLFTTSGMSIMSSSTLLDVEIRYPRWLFIALDDFNIEFSSTYHGLTFKNDPESAVGGLRHVAPDGSESYDPIAGCRLIYLAIVPPAHDYSDAFNLNLDIIQPIMTNGRTEISRLGVTIDPGIKYPGPK